MKYIRTKTDKVKTTTNKGHHKNLAKPSSVASAGRYKVEKSGKVKTYSKSHGLNKTPAKGDAKKIERKIKSR